MSAGLPEGALAAYGNSCSDGTYQPHPVQRVKYPNRTAGWKFGIPTALDRLIQQAVQQVLQGQWDPTFTEHSYGFRPGPSAHQAVARRSPMWLKATDGWLTSTWRNSLIESTMTG